MAKEDFCIILDSVSAVKETDFMKDSRVLEVPLVVNLGGEEWRDGERSLEYLVQRMEELDQLAQTSQPPLGELIELFTSLVNQGKKVIMVTMSSGLSGTYQTACMAAKQVVSEIKGADVRVIDGKTCGSPLIGQAKAILAKIDEGCEDMDELERFGLDVVRRTKTWFSVNTLEYLRKGGRIGKASALIGGLLGIRPILIMDKDGKVEAIDKCRTRKKVLQRLVDCAIHEKDVEELYFCGALCEEDLDFLQEKVTAVYPGVPFIRTSLGTVITSHIGPGALGVFLRVKE